MTQPPNRPAISEEQERTWGALVHAVPAVALVFSAGTLGFVASVIIYAMYKDRGTFVRQQAANSLNIQIMTLLGLAVAVVLMLVGIGFLLYPLVIVWAVVLHAIGSVRSSNGRPWRPPLVPRLVR